MLERPPIKLGSNPYPRPTVLPEEKKYSLPREEKNFDPSSEQTKADMQQLVAKLKAHGKSLGYSCEQEFDDFYNAFISKTLSHSSETLKEENFKGYGEVKYHLEAIDFYLSTNTDLAPSVKKSALNNTVLQFGPDVCGLGIIESLEFISARLAPYEKTPANWLAKARHSWVEYIADGILDEFYNNNNLMSIHVTEACVEYAESLGWRVRINKKKKSSVNGSRVNLQKENRQRYFHREWKSLYTPDKIVDNLVMEYKEYFYESFHKLEREENGKRKGYKYFESELRRVLDLFEISASLDQFITEEEGRLKPIDEKLFGQVIRPYILAYVISHDIIATPYACITLKNGDVLYNASYRKNFSYVKQIVGDSKEEEKCCNFFSYEAYLENFSENIPDNIRWKFELDNLFDSLFNKINDLHKYGLSYERLKYFAVYDWNELLGTKSFDYNRWFPSLSLFVKEVIEIPSVFMNPFAILTIGVLLIYDILVASLKFIVWNTIRSYDVIKEKNYPIKVVALPLLVPLCMVFSPIIYLYDLYRNLNHSLNKMRIQPFKQSIENMKNIMNGLIKNGDPNPILKFSSGIEAIRESVSQNKNNQTAGVDSLVLKSLEEIETPVIQTSMYKRLGVTSKTKESKPDVKKEISTSKLFFPVKPIAASRYIKPCLR